MEIYIVQPGDTIYSIAQMYGISVDRLILDNGLDNSVHLPIGHTIVIAYPKQEHIVQEGNTVNSIANTYQVSIMQILRNNPQLSDRDYLIPGETIIISYYTNGSIATNGYAYPYIKKDTLIKVLPNLTYLSVFNYSAIEKGKLKSYYDDTEIIQIAKEYSVKPLLMVASLSYLGEQNIEIAYDILVNEEYQKNHINSLLDMIKSKGYYGMNIVFNYMKPANQSLYINLINNISKRMQQEHYLFFITFNINFQATDNETNLEQVDYATISPLVNGMIFSQLTFIKSEPPSPVTNIPLIRRYMDYVVSQVSPDKILLGATMISYEWELPYIPEVSSAYTHTIESMIELAYDVGAVIQFDNVSQTPYFLYNTITSGMPSEHIVWSIDARTINAMFNIIEEHGLYGYGIWNVMTYYYQMWTMIHSQYDILKELPTIL